MAQPNPVSPEPTSTDAAAAQPARSKRFFSGVLWNWLGVAVNIAIGLWISPLIVRELGSDRYGVWALVFSLLDYLWFFDFGFNTALSNFVAHYRAKKDPEQVNRVINTSLVYFTAVAACFLLATLWGASHSDLFLPHASNLARREFRDLILITGIGWACQFPMHLFASCLEAYQRYDAMTKSWVATLLIRSIGCIVLLKTGFGLTEMGFAVVIGQVVGNLMAVVAFRRSFPELRFSRSLFSLSLVREMMGYGVHSFVANLSNLLLNQGPPVVIAQFRSAAFVGYFALPSRLLQYSVEAVTRVGFVTKSNVAEMNAQGEENKIFQMNMLLNRYCAVLFMPAVIYLLIYAKELIRRWISPDFAEQSGPLAPVMAVGILIAVAGQFNSISTLYGMAKHQQMARGLFVESVLTVVALWFVIPRYGLLGAAWALAILSTLNRGIYVAWLICRALHESFGAFLCGIYLRPAMTAIPVVALLAAAKSFVPGTTWPQLIVLAAATGLAYYGLAFFTCVNREHRGLMIQSGLRALRVR